MAMQHVIKKQFIELTLYKGLDHFGIQQLVSSQYWADIVPLLEKAFDKIGNNEEVIELDKLEIDLGMISLKSLEKNEWGSRLQSKIETLLSAITHPGSASGRAIPAPKRLNVFQQWFFYMQKGYLPWNTIQTDEQWYQMVLEALAVDFNSVQLLRDVIQKDRNILERIVTQHPAFFLQKLTEVFTAAKQNGLAGVIDELVMLTIYLKQEVNAAAPTEKKIKLELWAKAISTAALGNFSNARRRLDEQLIDLFFQDNKIVKKIPAEILSKLRLTLRQVEKNTEIVKTAREKEEKKSPSEKISKTDHKKRHKEVSFTENIEEGLKNGKQPSFAEKKILQSERVDASVETTERQFEKNIINNLDEEGIFVANAGIVLLHPFLHSLFTRLQLTHEGKFIDKKLQQKTLYIIHYLATGTVEAEEHELAIGKILSDHPLQEAVEKDIDLSKEILHEADEMINAAIQQWDKLTGTSIAGLREGFLQRKGKLSLRNGNLYLQVEQSAIDILLDYLPWNLGIIKLPWMKDILRVEWR
jgi:Contractile injection system tape measure protein